jgi:Mg2+/citrate symporter
MAIKKTKIYFKIMNDVITFDSLVQRSKQFTKDVNVDVSIIFLKKEKQRITYLSLCDLP